MGDDRRTGHAGRLSPGEDALAPYRALLAHAEAELELSGRGEIAQLAELNAHWYRLADALPDAPPDGAGDLLERARLIHERTRIELLRAREALLAELSAARRARAAAGGYGRETVRPRSVERSA